MSVPEGLDAVAGTELEAGRAEGRELSFAEVLRYAESEG
jgi:hypothetical protein